MTVLEKEFYETVIHTMVALASELKKLNEKLDKLTAVIEDKNEE